MKKWKRLALVAVAACLAALLAAALWRMGETAPPVAEPSAPASQSPAPATPQSLPPSASPSPSSPPPTPVSAAAQTPSPGPVPPGADPTPAPLSAPEAEAPEPAPAPSPAPQGEEERTADLCTLSVRCETILHNLDRLNADKVELVPTDGVLIAETAEEFEAGESAFDLLQRVCERQGVHLEFSVTPGYGSAYIEGVGNLYEFDCGDRSGWIYRVNGEVPSKGCSAYTLQPGDRVEFLYTCDWGNDL